jgi:Uma2 family endonuclease
MTSTQLPLTHEVAELFPRQGAWTEDDYWALPPSNRIIELAQRTLIVPPMPTPKHQHVVGNILFALYHFVRTHTTGSVVQAPVPVRLQADLVREPDVLVLLDNVAQRTHEQYYDPPDLAVEVLSPGTEKTDREQKLSEYAAAGVREYWIVAPETQTVTVYTLAGTAYTLAAHASAGEQMSSVLLAGFSLSLSDIFSTTA